MNTQEILFETKNPQLLIHDVSGCALFHGDCFSFSIPEYDYIISDLPYNTKYAGIEKEKQYFDIASERLLHCR